MKTVKKIFKVLVTGYIDNFKKSADMIYGHLY